MLAVATLGWVLTDEGMAGRDDGRGTDPGSLGFYVSAWIVMMAAMMLPSAALMVVTRPCGGGRLRPWLSHRVLLRLERLRLRSTISLDSSRAT
jgi:hypothetical protein